MTFKINTNVFSIVEQTNQTYLDLTSDFAELADVLKVVLATWNDTQTRREALLASTEIEAGLLRAMAETIITVCDKAASHHSNTVKEVFR